MTSRRRPVWLIGAILVLGVALCLGFAALGVWQLQRLGWKRDLIARVEARVHADPVPLAALDAMGLRDREYRRVSVSGRFDHSTETLVTAATELGGGYWVLTAFHTDDGRTVLINRGFVLPERRDPQSRAAGQVAGPVSVIGLARLSEPGGGFLRANDPGAGRWYSRDIATIAQARGLVGAEDIFIDAEASSLPEGAPVGGLTVIRFRDTHLVYALTWFTLSVLVAAGIALVLRTEWRQRDATDPVRPHR